MSNKNKVVSPVYQQIAIDIAQNIVNGKYTVGEKLSGRSTLASHYGVSPETIRRAVYILQDVGVLRVENGRGIEIVSKENTFKFLEQYQHVVAISQVKNNIKDWVKRQKEEAEVLMENVSRLLDATERYNENNPFTPFAIHLTADMKNLGKTSADVNFWQNTGATIIAIKHESDLILSPGPYASFEADDILYFIGEETCLERVKKLFY